MSRIVDSQSKNLFISKSTSPSFSTFSKDTPRIFVKVVRLKNFWLRADYSCPKFLMTPLFRTLQYFADFFRKHVDNLNSSFVIVMGDHGLRFGGIRQTSPGTIEDNNPLLTVTVHFLFSYSEA